MMYDHNANFARVAPQHQQQQHAYPYQQHQQYPTQHLAVIPTSPE